MQVNTAAFFTVTALAIGTGGAVYAAMTTTAAVAAIAYAILAVGLAGVSIASMTAWAASKDGESGSDYIRKLGSHAGIAVAASFQFVAQTLVQALIQGLASGVSTLVRRKIAGPDFTFEDKRATA
ncbi:MAG: hypothetical protein NTY13_03970 [Chlamydiae bacterium]|nr:hypothetical protein [Chlamydiota bacterium]